MPQVKVFGLKGELEACREALADVIHIAMRDVLGVTSEKRFQRYFALEPENFLHGPGRTNRYILIEIFMFEGRTKETRKRLIRMLFERVRDLIGISVDDVEIMLFEVPRHNWGIRGLIGDEMHLDYSVET